MGLLRWTPSTLVANQRGSDPKRLSHLLRGDLDVIVSKSLEKDRSRRYGTPSEFADDLQRFLSKEPIEARPPSAAYRLRKLYQRKKLFVMTSASVAAILVLATLFSAAQAIRATSAERLADERAGRLELEQEKTESALKKAEAAEAQQRKLREQAETAAEREQAAAERERNLRAEAEAAAIREQRQAEREAELRRKAQQSESEAQWNTYVARLFPMQQAWRERNFGRLEELLKDTIPGEREPDFRGWEWYFFEDQVKLASEMLWPTAKLIAAHPHADEFAVHAGNKISICDWNTRQLLREFDVPDHGRDVSKRDSWQLAWSPTGQHLAIAYRSTDRGATTWLCILNSSNGRELLHKQLFEWRISSERPSALAWKHDDSQIAIASRFGDISVIALDSGESTEIQRPEQEANYCESLAWHPSGRKLVAGLRLGERTLFDLESGEKLRSKGRSSEICLAMAWSQDGKLLATMEGKDIQLLNEQMENVKMLRGRSGTVTQIEWLPTTLLPVRFTDQSNSFDRHGAGTIGRR